MRVDDFAIEGLTVVTDWIQPVEEQYLLALVDPPGKPRPGRDRNRIDRFGPGVADSGYTLADRTQLEIPIWISCLFPALAELDVPEPDAVTVGWYLPGQHMRAHVDNPKAGPVIAVLALAGDATMRFTRDAETTDVAFPRRTLLVMRGPARWDYKHEILTVTEPRCSIVFRRASP